MLKFVHIISNNKFSPVEVFETTNSVNKYYCKVSSHDEDILYHDKTKVIAATGEELLSIVKKVDYDAVMFHPLSIDNYKLVVEVPNDKIIIWSVFGWELYNNYHTYKYIQNEITLYKPRTKAYLKRGLPWYNFIHKFHLGDFYRQITKDERYIQKLEQAHLFQKVMERVDYVAPVFDNEMGLINKIPFLHTKIFPFTYSKWHVGNYYEFKDISLSTSILLGNSAVATNNHLDVIEILKKRNICNKLYIPMAYGSPSYASYIQSVLDDNKIDAYVQTQMIPFEEYSTILSECRVAIMPHIRQQASDTIYINLLRGVKVFMYNDSVAYNFYKSKGFVVFSIDNDLTNDNIEKLLTTKQREHNRKLVLDEVSIEAIAKRINVTLDEIEKEHLQSL